MSKIKKKRQAVAVRAIMVRDSTRVEEAMDSLMDAVSHSEGSVDVPARPDPPDCVMGDVMTKLQEWMTKMERWAEATRENVQAVNEDVKEAARRLQQEIAMEEVGATTVRRR